MKIFMDNLKTIVEVMKIKKYRSMVIFSMYIVFITMLVIFLRFQEKTVVLKDYINSYREYNNYNFTYTMIGVKDGIVDIKEISGKRYSNRFEFNYLDQIYDKELVNFPITDVNINKLTNEYIYKYLLESIKEDNNIYQVNLDDFIYLMQGITIDSKDIITIEIIENNGLVNQIVIDLTNYDNYFDNKYNEFKVVINYTNIGKVIAF